VSTRRRLLAIAAIAIVAFGWWYGQGIVPRLSNHRGYQLIAVDDRVSEAAAAAYAPVRPRRVFLVLVDGLRADVAATLGSVQKLRAAGVCRRTHVSLPTVSRPVYALVSTGVEQDRSGARNNDESSPLAAESIWQVARAAGRRVAGVSVLTWWRELWPDGFDRYEKLAPEDDLFARAARADEDLVLVHPAYVDEAGHEHGGASRVFRRLRGGDPAQCVVGRHITGVFDRLIRIRKQEDQAADDKEKESGDAGVDVVKDRERQEERNEDEPGQCQAVSEIHRWEARCHGLRPLSCSSETRRFQRGGRWLCGPGPQRGRSSSKSGCWWPERCLRKFGGPFSLTQKAKCS